MKPVVRVRVRVRGRVQGVWFRGATRDRALALAVTGWVRNLPDGGVELEAQGAAGEVDELVQWCKTGPPAARVDGVNVEPMAPVAGSGAFEIRR